MTTNKWQNSVAQQKCNDSVQSIEDEGDIFRVTFKGGTGLNTIYDILCLLENDEHLNLTNRRFLSAVSGSSYQIEIEKTPGVTIEKLQSLFQDQSLAVSNASAR